MIRITKTNGEIMVLESTKLIVVNGTNADAFNLEDIDRIDVIPDQIIRGLELKYGKGNF